MRHVSFSPQSIEGTKASTEIRSGRDRIRPTVRLLSGHQHLGSRIRYVTKFSGGGQDALSGFGIQCDSRMIIQNMRNSCSRHPSFPSNIMGSNSSLHVSAEIRVNDRLHSAAKPQSQSGVTRRANFVANGDKERGLMRDFSLRAGRQGFVRRSAFMH